MEGLQQHEGEELRRVRVDMGTLDRVSDWWDGAEIAMTARPTGGETVPGWLAGLSDPSTTATATTTNPHSTSSSSSSSSRRRTGRAPRGTTRRSSRRRSVRAQKTLDPCMVRHAFVV